MDPGGASPEPSRREALSKALLEEGDRLYALALRVTRDPDLAADAVQEAFATALERESDFRGESRLATWLHRIVYTKSIDLLRKRGREGPLPEDDPEGRAPHGEDEGRAPSWARPPDALLLGRETRAALEKALGALTPVQRAIFELKEVEGRPTEEVGAILGIPPGTVRVHLHRARLKLRSLLGEHFRRGRT
jgi:RNA polymerase sigma-70 factor (ECF subfamily)